MNYFFLILAFISIPLQARVITACGHPEYPPVSWLQQGSVTGVAPSIAKLLFSELGYQVTIDSSGNWKRCLQEVRAGNIDVVVAAYKTKPRTEFLAYSAQHLIADRLSIFVNKADNRDYNSQTDLQDKRVGLLLGDSFGDQFDHFLQGLDNREFVSKGEQNFAKLAYQRIDFMPLGVLSGQLQLQKFGYQKQVRITNITIGTEHYYLAVSRSSNLQKHLPYIDKRITQLHQDGSIDRLQMCFGEYYLNVQQPETCNELL